MIEFSVVIPTRGRPAQLDACLRALAPGAQTLDASRYEVIVSDDARGEPVALPWLRWTPGPARGPAANRNHGARQARGAWLAFIDDDCVPQPGWLDAFAKHRATDRAIRVLEGRTTVAEGERWTPRVHAPTNETGGFLWSCNFAVERELFERLEGFDENFPAPHLEDVDFRLRLQAANEPFAFVPEAHVVHPLRPVLEVDAQVRAAASAFHLARKHGLSPAEAGLGWGVFARAFVQSFRLGRTPGEWLWVLGRHARLAVAMLLRGRRS